MGRSAHGTEQVYLDLTLPGYCLRDITILVDYVHIQKVELPYNNLTDLTALSAMPYLVELDVSHNKISTLNDFAILKSVKIADLSYNSISEFVNLSSHHYLTELCLDYNQIEEILGLEHCSRMKHLSLGHNKLQEIKGLDGLPITRLDLQYNELTRISNLEGLKLLLQINLSGNKITSLNGLQGLEFIEAIDVEDNQIADLDELDYVLELKTLRDLNMRQNPIQALPDYRLSVLFRLQRLTELDRNKAEAEEKVASVNLFAPTRGTIAARDHIMHVVYSFLQPGKLMECTLPSMNTPYPMLVLVGPEGSGKEDLALKLVAEFPEYFGFGIAHTTRKPYPHEVPDKHYHFMSLDEFEDEIRYGQFLFTYNYAGYWYGLTMEAVESVARDGLACVVHMELEGVLTLKNTHFEPRIVFIMPISPYAHEQRMNYSQLYQESEITLALSRSQIYIEQNVENPGFFDMYINSDDLTDAYARLRRLVLDYLGVTNQTLTNTGVNQDQPGTQQSNRVADIAKPWSQGRARTPMSAEMEASSNLHLASSQRRFIDVGSLEAISTERRQKAARETLFDCDRPRTHDLVFGRATRSCMDRIRTSAEPRDEMFTNSSSSANSSESRNGSFDEWHERPVQHRRVESPEQSPITSGSSEGTSQNTLNGSNGSFSEIRKNTNETWPQPARPDSNPCARPGSDKHRVLPPIASPLPV